MASLQSILLLENEVPVMGVIYVPVKDTLYIGSQEGAFKYEAYTAGGSCKEALPLLKGNRSYTVVGSHSHMSPETETFFEEKKKEYGEVEVMAVGSSLKLCMVEKEKQYRFLGMLLLWNGIRVLDMQLLWRLVL